MPRISRDFTRRNLKDLTRILDLLPSNEDLVVSRVLMLVHKAVDENFPRAEKPNRQFSKTVFSDDGFEKTGQIFVHTDRKDQIDSRDESNDFNEIAEEEILSKEKTNLKTNEAQFTRTEFGTSERTDTELGSRYENLRNREIPEELPIEKDPQRSSLDMADPLASSSGFSDSSSAHSPPIPPNKNIQNEKISNEFSEDDATKLEDTFGLMKQQLEPTWVSRVTIAFLLAGIILLVYVLLW